MRIDSVQIQSEKEQLELLQLVNKKLENVYCLHVLCIL